MSTFTFAKPAKVHALKTLVIFRSITRKRVIIVIQAVLTVTFITKKSHCRPQSYVALFETTSGDLPADRTVRRLWVQERRIPSSLCQLGNKVNFRLLSEIISHFLPVLS